MKFTLSLTLLLFLAGCVGTLDDKSLKPVFDAGRAGNTNISFQGITYAEPTSHQSITLYFPDATGIQGDAIYLVYLDGDTNIAHASTTQNQLNKNSENLNYITISGLNIGTTYQFNMAVLDNASNTRSAISSSVSATTLNQYLPIFDGIDTVENLPGQAGETGVLLSWNKALPAKTSSNIFLPDPYKITGYTISYGLSSDDLNTTITIADGDTLSSIVPGLNPNTTYYFRVRARDNASPSPKTDQNTKVLSITTRSVAPIIFQGLESASIPTNTSGYSTIKLNWQGGSGSFDRYRVFYSFTPKSSFNPETDSFITDITDLSLSSYDLTVPEPNITYYLALVACNNSDCDDYAGNNRVLLAKTSPPIAPFDGIQAVVPPSGEDGLSSLDISWELPDITNGVYNEIKVFRTSVDGTYDPTTEVLSNNGNQANFGFDANFESSTTRRVTGLTTGQEYCFVAKAYATTPVDPMFLDGRTHDNERVVCNTPQLINPGFNGALSCANINSSELTILWDEPNPLGLFDYYELYIREGQDGFNFDDAIAGSDPSYVKSIVSKNSLSRKVTNLKPGVYYQIGVKTYFENQATSEDIRDTNQSIITCQTQPVRYIHNGWDELFAVGPKIDGLTGQPIPETIVEVDPPNLPMRIPLEADITEALGVTASDQGIVRLVWAEMTLTDGRSMIDFDGPLDGYNVYRQSWAPAHESNFALVANGTWERLNSTPIKAIPYNDGTIGAKHINEFTDYTVTQLQPDPSEEKRARSYWYKVVPQIGGIELTLDDNPGDHIVRIILPPRNMALVHRWMANKEACERLQQAGLSSAFAPNRSQNYSCQYNGIGAPEGRIDSKGHQLIDRFQLACNFTRGNPSALEFNDKGCRTADRTAPSMPNNPNNLAFVGRETNTETGVIEGDCISGSRNYINYGPSLNGIETQGKRGSIIHDRDPFKNSSTTAHYQPFTSSTIGRSEGGSCYINVSPEFGPDWLPIDVFEPPSTPLNTSRFPAQVSGLTTAGEGLGSVISTNNAKMPPIIAVSKTNMERLCMGHQVFIDSHTTPKIKTLPSRRMFIEASAPPLLNRPEIQREVEKGTYVETGNVATPPPEIAILDRDCHSAADWDRNRKSVVNRNTALSDIYDTTVNFNHNNWAFSGAYIGNRHINRHALISGSAGPSSSDYCQSRYGVQDYVGNFREYVSDDFFCTDTFCSPAHNNINYVFSSDDQTLESHPLKRKFVENWRNADGFYYSLTSLNPNTTPSIGGPTTTNFTNSMADFVNLVLGLPINCTSNACNDQTNDDTLVSLKDEGLTNSPTPVTETFGFEFSDPPLFRKLNWSNLNPLGMHVTLTMGGTWNRYNDSLEQKARYMMELSPGEDWYSQENGGRCALMIYENADRSLDMRNITEY